MPSAYTPTGPWSNGGAPGISAAFLTSLEAFLVALNSATYDASISADGSGNLSVVGLVLSTGHIVMPNTLALQIKDSGGTAHDVLYVNSSNQLCIQMANSSADILLKDASGGNLVRINGTSGNMRVKGTITPSVTP